jgi:hypothetical protein
MNRLNSDALVNVFGFFNLRTVAICLSHVLYCAPSLLPINPLSFHQSLLDYIIIITIPSLSLFIYVGIGSLVVNGL